MACLFKNATASGMPCLFENLKLLCLVKDLKPLLMALAPGRLPAGPDVVCRSGRNGIRRSCCREHLCWLPSLKCVS